MTEQITHSVAPIEPTPEMLQAGFEVLAQAKANRWTVEQTLPILWRAMLAVSHPAPADRSSR